MGYRTQLLNPSFVLELSLGLLCSFYIKVISCSKKNHCKSKDDDFGDKSVQPGGSWSGEATALGTKLD